MAIKELLESCFPTQAEAALVERLRADRDAVIALVATEHRQVAGYAMLSKMQAPFKALGLAPVAVDEAMRRQGIGERLIEEALRQASIDGWEVVFVLGDPAYFRRFGFSAAAAEPFSSPYAGPHFMALSLNVDALIATSGHVDYASAFSALE